MAKYRRFIIIVIIIIYSHKNKNMQDIEVAFLNNTNKCPGLVHATCTINEARLDPRISDHSTDAVRIPGSGAGDSYRLTSAARARAAANLLYVAAAYWLSIDQRMRLRATRHVRLTTYTQAQTARKPRNHRHSKSHRPLYQHFPPVAMNLSRQISEPRLGKRSFSSTVIAIGRKYM